MVIVNERVIVRYVTINDALLLLFRIQGRQVELEALSLCIQCSRLVPVLKARHITVVGPGFVI
jgi:hypothetical protein